MDALQTWVWQLSILIIFASLIPVHESVKKKDNCEYDMDLTRNVIKITCDGSASSVNVYAETAHVSSDEEVEGVNAESEAGDDNDVPGKRYDNKDSNANGHTQPGRGRTNKELRGGPTGSEYVRMSADHGTGGKWDFSQYDSSPFSDVVWNATQKLDDARRKLTNYAGTLKNTSNWLSDGDLKLRTDMDQLRRTSNSANELKEGIVAAMRNQYNFMRTMLLSHNHELVRVMDSLDVLVNVTSDGFHSALMAHKSDLEQIHRLNATLSAVKKMVSAELRKRYRRRGLKKGNNTKVCPKEISAIGNGFSRKMSTKDGAYMVESYTPNLVNNVWVMEGSDICKRLDEYESATDIDYDVPGRYSALPFTCHGTGHAVYRRHFYCHVKDSNKVMKYSIKKMDIVAEVVLPGTHFERFLYKANANNEVDLAVDEKGLWAIYATVESGGKLVISKINHNMMEVEKTWVTSEFKTDVGNAFMICGTLYATYSHSASPTYIRYTYDTENSTGQQLEPGQIPFPNSANMVSKKNKYRTHQPTNSVMLSYDFRSSMLYSWTNYNVEIFPVYFSKLTV